MTHHTALNTERDHTEPSAIAVPWRQQLKLSQGNLNLELASRRHGLSKQLSEHEVHPSGLEQGLPHLQLCLLMCLQQHGGTQIIVSPGSIQSVVNRFFREVEEAVL